MHVVIYYIVFFIMFCAVIFCIFSINSLLKRLQYYEDLFIGMRNEIDNYINFLNSFSRMDLYSDNEELKMLINKTKSVSDFMDRYEWIEEKKEEE